MRKILFAILCVFVFNACGEEKQCLSYSDNFQNCLNIAVENKRKRTEEGCNIAKQIFLVGCENKNAKSCLGMAQYHETGGCNDHDLKKTEDYERIACELDNRYCGDAGFRYTYGKSLRPDKNGYYTKPDKDKAIMYFEMSCNVSTPPLGECKTLGDLYRYGKFNEIEIQIDIDKAIEYYGKVCPKDYYSGTICEDYRELKRKRANGEI